MNAKTYLSQARLLDARINARLEQAAHLRATMTRGVQTLSMTPRGGPVDWTATMHRVMELEEEINADIDRLVTLQRDIARAIAGLDCPTHRALLEMRYLSGWGWRRIARALHYSERQIWRMHAQALERFVVPEE